MIKDNQIFILPPEKYNINDRIKPILNYILYNLKYIINNESNELIKKDKINAINGNIYDKFIFINKYNLHSY